MTDARYSTLPTRHGLVRFFSNDDPIGRSLSEYGEWAGLELNLLAQLIRNGDTVVDVGANVGTHTLEFAHRAGPQGRVMAFEPQPRVLELLKENVATAKAANVTIVGMAVGGAAGTVFIDALPDGLHANYGAARVSPAGSVPVDLVTIDSLNLDACHFIKVDAEGHGGEVLSGARETISRFRPIVFIECNDVRDAADISRSEALSSYDLYFVRCPAFNFGNFRHNPVNLFGLATETSVLAMPKEGSIRSPEADLVVVDKVGDLDDLAARVLSSPRFGDETPFDRVTSRHELEGVSAALGRARLREMNLQRQIAMLRGQVVTSPIERLIARLRRTPLWPLLAPVRAIVRRYLEKHNP